MTEFNWATASPEARRAHWVTALRSAKYTQGQGYLRTGIAFCCLGVLCDLHSPTWDTERELGFEVLYQHLGATFDMMPPEDIVDQVGLSPGQVEALANFNDAGETFDQIATRIETNDYDGACL